MTSIRAWRSEVDEVGVKQRSETPNALVRVLLDHETTPLIFIILNTAFDI